MKRVYIAGKLNDTAVGYVQNVSNMLTWGEKVRKLGFSVFVPALDFLIGLKIGDWGYTDYFENSQPWLDVSDYLFVCPNSEDSKGTQAEIARAKKLNIPTFYDLVELAKQGPYKDKIEEEGDIQH